MRVLLPFASFLFLLTPLVVAAQEGVVASEDADIYEGGPAAPVIISEQFTDPETWYRPTDVTFSWNLSENITAVAADLSSSKDFEPQTSYRPPVDEVTFNSIELLEGVNYLSVQFRNDEKWGEFTVRPIKIDATAPELFSISVTPLKAERPALILSWEAEDALSGISHYTVEIDGNNPERLTYTEAKNGYLLDVDPYQQYNVRVTAYDEAGNSRMVEALIVPTAPLTYAQGSMVGSVTNNAASLLVAVMSAIMLLMFGYMIFERQRYATRLKRFKKEANDIHDQLLRIFTALREEIHDQIRGITKKKRLNKNEKEAVDGLNKALSVSEMLLDKEVQDVKKLIEE